MSALVLLVLILAMADHSRATWCVCKDGLSDTVLQKALDYACGAGADCNPIHQNGACYNPNTVKAHCSYAVNSYFQRKGQSGGTCDFAGSAAISTTDPSITGCVYPSSISSAGTPTAPVITAPSTTTTPPSTTTTTPPSTTTTTTSPYTTTPTSTGIYGGFGTGISPSGINNDYSHGGLTLRRPMTTAAVIFSSLVRLMFLWG